VCGVRVRVCARSVSRACAMCAYGVRSMCGSGGSLVSSPISLKELSVPAPASARSDDVGDGLGCTGERVRLY